MPARPASDTVQESAADLVSCDNRAQLVDFLLIRSFQRACGHELVQLRCGQVAHLCPATRLIDDVLELFALPNVARRQCAAGDRSDEHE